MSLSDLINCRNYVLACPFDITQHIIVPKSQDVPAVAFQALGSLLVVYQIMIISMLGSV